MHRRVAENPKSDHSQQSNPVLQSPTPLRRTKVNLFWKLKARLGNPEIQPASLENPTEIFVKDVLSCSPENFPMTFDRFMNSVVQGTYEVANFQSQEGPMSDDQNCMNEVFDYLSHCEIPDGLVQEQRAELDRCYDERKQELMHIRDDGNARTKRAEDKEAALLQVHKKFMLEQGEVCEVQQKLELVKQDNTRLRV
jgi:hypothetical protein